MLARSSSPRALLLVLLLGTAPTARAQAVRPGMPDTDGNVNAIEVIGEIAYLGGAFSILGHQTGSGAAVDSTAGHPFELATAGLAPGLYLVEATAGSERRSGKFVVTR